MSTLVCLGLGYSAAALVRRLESDGTGWRIIGTARSADGLAAIRAAGWEAIAYDGATPSPALADGIENATHLVASAAPDDNGDPVLRHHRADIDRAPVVRWIGYLSTIGVYGDTSGEWIDETAEPKPGSPRTERRVAAEREWLALARPGRQVQVFRLGGIYGPGRSVIEDLAAGTARRIVKPGQVFNRIHVDDIAAVLAAAMRGRGRHAIYDVTDGAPSPPQDVVAYAAERTGLPLPPELPYATADLSPMARSFYAENRRVRAARIRDDLGVTLAYPSYREGIDSLAEAWRGSAPGKGGDRSG